MTFLSREFFKVIVLVLLALISSCRGKIEENISSPELDTISFDGMFFANETILIKADDSVLLRMQVDSTRKFQTVYKQIIIKKTDTDTVQLSVQTFFDEGIVIDTSFTIPPRTYIESIGGSICYPSHVSVDSLRKIKEPRFGYIPLDSCKRYLSLVPDSTLYKYPIY